MSFESDVKRIEKDLIKAVNQMVSKPFLDELGRRAVEIIKLRTRLGYGVPKSSDNEDRPEKKPFDKLSPRTIAARKKALGRGELGSKVTTESQSARLKRQGIVKKATKGRVQKAIKSITRSGKVSTKIKRLKKAIAAPKKQVVPKKLAPGTSPTKSNLTFTGEMVEAIESKTNDRGVIITVNDHRDKQGKNKIGNKQLATYHMTGTNKMPQRRFLDLAKGDVNQLRLFMRQFFKAVFDRLK